VVRVKICCIASLEEAELAKRYGAHALGLVSAMPTGERWISDARIREIAAAHPDVKRFLLTCRTDPDAIRRQTLAAGTDTVQLVDRMELPDLAVLREGLPGIALVQVVHVTGPAAVAEARRVEPYVDAVLLDSGTPDTRVRSLGGTGKTHDWNVSAEIVGHLDCPVFLAGGLGPHNVAEAIQRVRPYGVDVCSGLRPNGRLDEHLLAQFSAAVARAPSAPPSLATRAAPA
jgi:phosphoribosylanthranilate isomerase